MKKITRKDFFLFSATAGAALAMPGLVKKAGADEGGNGDWDQKVFDKTCRRENRSFKSGVLKFKITSPTRGTEKIVKAIDRKLRSTDHIIPLKKRNTYEVLVGKNDVGHVKGELRRFFKDYKIQARFISATGSPRDLT